jgi:hypothetical protein
MYPNIIVTAANSQYFNSLRQLIYSFYSTYEYKQSQMVCYDIGLGSQELDSLEQFIKKIGVPVEIRRFDFDAYPDIVRLEHKTYSWKPIIINEVLNEKKCNLLWMDSANIILKNLHKIWKEIEITGQYLPISGSGTLERWTHSETLERLKVPNSWKKNRNRCGGLCGFSFYNEPVKKLVADWVDFALDWNCIKPDGADRSNHRDDQSILSIISYSLEEKGLIKLTVDEVDISSARPTGFVSVRNMLKSHIPLWLMPWSIMYFKLRRLFDIRLNKLKSLFF